MAHSSVPGLFEPKSERIDDYKERFDFYCVAHGVAEETLFDQYRSANVWETENMDTT